MPLRPTAPRRWTRSAAAAATLVTAVATIAAWTMGPASAATAAPDLTSSSTAASGPDHVFVIMMENHGYEQVVGNTADAPYITSLARTANVATNYHGVTHPSLPNYLATVSGSFQGIWDDCKAGADVTCAPEEFVPGSGDATDTAALTPQQYASASATPHLFSGRTIIDQVEASGRTWKAYMQSMPSPGFQGEYAPTINGTSVKLYAQKHNPFMYFSDINAPGNPRLQNIVPFESQFSNDLVTGNVANFTWISPDQCHDMHGMSASSAALVGLPQCGYPATGLDHGAIQLGDTFVHDTVNAITASKTWKTTRSSIVLVWDENDYSGYSGGPGSPVGASSAVLGGGHAPMMVLNSSGGPQHNTDQVADHYTLLSTIEHLWHLGCLANTCSPTTSGTFEQLFRH